MVLNCEYCGNAFFLKEHRLFYLKYLPKVCSIDCLIKLFNQPSADTLCKQPIKKDFKLNNYRSKWEVDFSKFLTNHKIDFLYEPFAFNVFKNNYYIPDFYLPKSHIFIEVKGKWESNAKAKFIHFVKNFNFKIYLANDAVIKLIRRGQW